MMRAVLIDKQSVGIIFAVLICVLLVAPGGCEQSIQPFRLIDAQTAGVLPKGTYDIETRVYPSGDSTITGAGLLLGIAVGITDRFDIGLSYGGDGLVGRGRARPNPAPGAFVKYRILDENYVVPAFALGYDHQGFGGIQDGHRGYVYKSQGFFLAASKSYLLFQKMQLGFHGAANYSLEDTRNVKWPNGYAGADFGINEELTFAGEYDFALNEPDPNRTTYYDPLDGYLNVGVRWAFGPSFYVEFDAKDVLQKKLDIQGRRMGWSRELQVVYLNRF